MWPNVDDHEYQDPRFCTWVLRSSFVTGVIGLRVVPRVLGLHFVLKDFGYLLCTWPRVLDLHFVLGDHVLKSFSLPWVLNKTS
jgi:hypothetical protein